MWAQVAVTAAAWLSQVTLSRELSLSVERLQIHGDQKINTGLSAEPPDEPSDILSEAQTEYPCSVAFLSALLHYCVSKESLSLNFQISIFGFCDSVLAVH